MAPERKPDLTIDTWRCLAESVAVVKNLGLRVTCYVGNSEEQDLLDVPDLPYLSSDSRNIEYNKDGHLCWIGRGVGFGRLIRESGELYLYVDVDNLCLDPNGFREGTETWRFGLPVRQKPHRNAKKFAVCALAAFEAQLDMREWSVRRICGPEASIREWFEIEDEEDQEKASHLLDDGTALWVRTLMPGDIPIGHFFIRHANGSKALYNAEDGELELESAFYPMEDDEAFGQFGEWAHMALTEQGPFWTFNDGTWSMEK